MADNSKKAGNTRINVRDGDGRVIETGAHMKKQMVDYALETDADHVRDKDEAVEDVFDDDIHNAVEGKCQGDVPVDEDELTDPLGGKPVDDLPKEFPIDEVSEWIAEMPDFRRREVEYVERRLGSKPSVDDRGNLMAPIAVGDWTMLLVYDSRFPKITENGRPCAILYFVDPQPEQVAAITGVPIDQLSGVGDGGNRYLVIDKFSKFRKTYSQGRSKVLMAEKIVGEAERLRRDYESAKMAAHISSTWQRHTITSSRYTDTRSSVPNTSKHPACKKVVLSDRAFVQIYNETQAHIRTETGGLLLGHFEDGVWYVVEACDPGWDAVFRHSYHEANEHYENHVCGIISRTYLHPLTFLGMWHRHPGSLDTFSGTDDATNSKYVDACGNGCISALVNYDPDYRITFYYVERAPDGGVAYYQVDVEVGDDRFANPNILRVASVPGGAVGVTGRGRNPAPPVCGKRSKGGHRAMIEENPVRIRNGSAADTAPANPYSRNVRENVIDDGWGMRQGQLGDDGPLQSSFFSLLESFSSLWPFSSL